MLVKRGMNPHDYNFLLGSRSLSKGEAVVRELQSCYPLAKHRLFTHSLDLESNDSAKKFIKWIRGEWECVDIWVNNSGIMIKDEEARRNTIQTAQTVLDVNFLDTVDITEMVIDKIMRKNGKMLFLGSSYAQLKFISDQNLAQTIRESKNSEDLRNCVESFMRIARSLSINDGTHFSVPPQTEDFAKYWQFPEYMLSKLLVNRYAQILAKDQRIIDLGVQVNSVCPGWVKTDMGGKNAVSTIEHACETFAHLIHDMPYEINPDYQGKLVSEKKPIDLDF